MLYCVHYCNNYKSVIYINIYTPYMYIIVFQYLYSLHFYKYFILYIHISPPLFLRILRLVYIKVKSLFIHENISVVVVYLKIL